MFEKTIFLAGSGTFSGGGFGDLLSKLESAGFFSYVIPFLLLFAVIFGILTKTKIFQENKSINGIISFAVALMALQFDFVPTFFSQLFPRLGVGLSIVLVILILLGLFTDPQNKTINWVLFGVAAIIIVFVLVKSTNAVGWGLKPSFQQDWFGQNLDIILAGIFVIAIIAIIMSSGKEKKQKEVPFNPIMWKNN